MAQTTPAREADRIEKPGVAPVDMKFETVVIPVSDIERARKHFGDQRLRWCCIDRLSWNGLRTSSVLGPESIRPERLYRVKPTPSAFRLVPRILLSPFPFSLRFLLRLESLGDVNVLDAALLVDDPLST